MRFEYFNPILHRDIIRRMNRNDVVRWSSASFGSEVTGLRGANSCGRLDAGVVEGAVAVVRFLPELCDGVGVSGVVAEVLGDPDTMAVLVDSVFRNASADFKGARRSGFGNGFICVLAEGVGDGVATAGVAEGTDAWNRSEVPLKSVEFFFSEGDPENLGGCSKGEGLPLDVWRERSIKYFAWYIVLLVHGLLVAGC